MPQSPKYFYFVLFLIVQLVFLITYYSLEPIHYVPETHVDIENQHFPILRYHNGLQNQITSKKVDNIIIDLLPDPAPKVSVIIPCYNKGDIIIETVISLLEQDYKNFEILIVNDGSTDEKTLHTLDLISTVQEEFEGNAPIYILNKRNGGLSSARNYGLKHINSSTEFIIFLDNDDLLHRNAISLMVLCILDNPQAAYCYPDQFIFGNTLVWWKTQEYNSYDLLWANHPTVCSIFRKNVILANQYNTDLKKGMEDYNMWLSLSAKGFQGIRLPLPIFEYRTSSDSMSAEITRVNKGEIIRSLVLLHQDTLYQVSKIDETKRTWRPFVSIVLSICYISDDLINTVESLKSQSFIDFELILVSYCRDSSSFQLTYLQTQYPFITQYIEPHISEYNEFRLRNEGAKHAKGDFLLFLQRGEQLTTTALEKLSLRAFLTYFTHKPKEIKPEESCFILSSSFGSSESLKKPTPPTNGTALTWEFVNTFLRFNPFIITRKWFNDYAKYYDGRYNYYKDENINLFSKLITSKCFYLTIPDPLSISFNNLPKVEAITHHSNQYDFNNNVISSKDIDLEVELNEVDELFTYMHENFLLLLRNTVRNDKFRSINTLAPFIPSYYHFDHNSSVGWGHGLDHRPHVLYLIPFMDIGGSEVVDLLILEALKESGFYVVLVTEIPHKHPWRLRFEALVGEIFHINDLVPKGLNCDINFNARMTIMDYLITSRNIDVIFNRNTFIGYDYFQYKTVYSSAYDYERHVMFCDLVHLYTTGGAWEKVSAENYEFIDKQFVISEDLRQYTIKTYKIPNDKFSVIYNGIDYEKWSPNLIPKGKLRSLLDIPKDGVIVGLVARVVEQKDPIRWINVAINVIRRNENYYFVLIGDGDLLPKLEEIIREERLEDKIFLLGQRDEIDELMIDFDILMMTSKYEGIPVAMLESMSLGIPVISTNVGGVKECVINDGIHGYVLPLGSSIEDFVFAVEKMRSAQSLKKFKPEILRNSIIKKFSIASMKNAYVKQILELVVKARAHYPTRVRDYILQKIDTDAEVYLDC